MRSRARAVLSQVQPARNLAIQEASQPATGPRLDFGTKNDEKIQVLRIGLPIVEDLRGLQESISSLSRSRLAVKNPNSILVNNPNRILLNSSYCAYFPTLGQWLSGVPWAAVI